jgi:hypothetical protein
MKATRRRSTLIKDSPGSGRGFVNLAARSPRSEDQEMSVMKDTSYSGLSEASVESSLTSELSIGRYYLWSPIMRILRDQLCT